MEGSNFDDIDIYKIVIIGDSGVGKTNVITKYVSNSFEEVSRPTIGVEFFQKDIIFKFEKEKAETVRLQIWDTAGQERFRGMASSYYRKAYGVLLVYDVTNRESYLGLDKWLDEINAYADQAVEVILIGNKDDLVSEREVSTEEGENYSKKNKLTFYETSAKLNQGKILEKVFELS